MQYAADTSSANALLSRLEAVLGTNRVTTDPQELEFFASDVYAAGRPGLAAIRPADIDALAAAVAEITAAGCAVVPRGGGMSYTGGYAPVRDATVTVDLRDLNRIIEIDEQDMLITVEAGVTWRQIFEALNPLGLRLPFFGTFSGSVATVGGGLSNGALFMGTGRYGTAAETVLGLQVLLADGSLLDTGQAAFRNGRPFYRTFGPDLTGAFLHDSGALGIKTQATLRLIRPPAEVDYLSFVLPDIRQAARTLSEVARSGAVEEAYVFDPATTRNSLASLGLGQDLRKLFKVVGGQSGLIKGLKAGAGLVAGGRDFVPEDAYSLHIVCAGRSAAAVADDIAACRAVAAEFDAPEITNSIPKAARADPFPPLNGILGPGGTRWAALNAKVRHSDAERIIEATQACLAPHSEAMQAQGIHLSQLLIAISNHGLQLRTGLPLARRMAAGAPAHGRGEVSGRPRRTGTEPAGTRTGARPARAGRRVVCRVRRGEQPDRQDLPVWRHAQAWHRRTGAGPEGGGGPEGADEPRRPRTRALLGELMAGHRLDSGVPLDAAVISVADIAQSIAFYRDQVGLDLLADDTVDDPAMLAYWHAGQPIRCALLGHGPDPVGRVMLLQLGQGERPLIREPAQRSATGLANLNFYTEDIHADYEKFRQFGYTFWSEPVQHDFGPRVGTPIEVVFDGPDGVAINLVELITPNDATLIGEMRRFVADYGRTATGYTPVVTSAHNLRSMEAAVAFYERVLGMHVAIDEVLESEASNHFLGLADDARTHTVFVQGAHMFGKIALAQPLNYQADSLVDRAVSPNIGYLAQSFRVDDLDQARRDCVTTGAQIYSDMTELDVPGRGQLRTMLVRNPGSGALQELFEA